MNINKELAEVMEYTVDRFENGAAICFSEYSNVLGGCETRIIDYRDPAIFVKCVEFLAKTNARTYHLLITAIAEFAGGEFDSIEVAVALARIEAGKQ